MILKYRNILLHIKNLLGQRVWQRRLKFFGGVCLCLICFYLFDVLKAAPSEQKEMLTQPVTEDKTEAQSQQETKKQVQSTDKKPKAKAKDKTKKAEKAEQTYETKTTSKKELIQQRAGKININEADKDTLMEIPYVGAKKADDIIAYRNDFPFTAIEDLMEVKGIGEKTFDKIAEFITV